MISNFKGRSDTFSVMFTVLPMIAWHSRYVLGFRFGSIGLQDLQDRPAERVVLESHGVSLVDVCALPVSPISGVGSVDGRAQTSTASPKKGRRSCLLLLLGLGERLLRGRHQCLEVARICIAELVVAELLEDLFRRALLAGDVLQFDQDVTDVADLDRLARFFVIVVLVVIVIVVRVLVVLVVFLVLVGRLGLACLLALRRPAPRPGRLPP